MMRNFTNEDFDEFLKRNADEYRMRPSLKVWKNISAHLSRRRRTIFFTTIGFVLLSGFAGYLLLEEGQSINQSAAIATSEKPKITTAPIVTDTETTPVEVKNDRVPGTQQNLTGSTNMSIAVNNIRNVSTRPLRTAVAEENTQPVQPDPAEREFVPQVVDSDPTIENTKDNAANLKEISQNEDPLSIESVVNNYNLVNKNGKLVMQVFLTPTVSYRKLSENKGYTPQPASSNGTNYPAIYSINDAVTHKPDMGLELGLTAKYALDENIKLRGGLQFNVSRYNIKAFTYTSELATIALGRGGSGSVDYVDQISSHRNFDGNRPDWLQNMYFQVSAPVGLELKLSGNDKASFGVASTLQPSYMLGERAYMLSSDYKNYTKVPELVRRWNVATNLETFVSYSTGDVKWQVGPQVRYQLFSSFVSKYPVKEHLFDFGLKVGVSLNRKKMETDIK